MASAKGFPDLIGEGDPLLGNFCAGCGAKKPN